MTIDEGGVSKGGPTQPDSDQLSPLDKLRGPNSTLKLLDVLVQYGQDIHDEYRLDEFRRRHQHYATILYQNYPVRYIPPRVLFLMKIHRWARETDKVLTDTIATSPPGDRASLEEVISDLVTQKKVSRSQCLIKPDKYDINGLRLKSLVPYEQEDWVYLEHCILKPLFGLNVAVEFSEGFPRLSFPFNYLPHHLPELIERISSATKDKGGVKESKDSAVTTYLAPTIVDGVSAGINLNKENIDNPQLHLTLIADIKFLASMRPLPDYVCYEYGLALVESSVKKHEEDVQEAVNRQNNLSTQRLGRLSDFRTRNSNPYHSTYDDEVSSARKAREGFKGTEADWMRSLYGNKDARTVPPWIWWDIYHRR